MNLTLPTKLLLLALPGAVESVKFFKLKSLSVDPSATAKPAGASPPSAAREPTDEDGLLSQQCLENNYEALEMDPEFQKVEMAVEQSCHPSALNVNFGEDGVLAVAEFGLCDWSGLEEYCNAHADYQAVRFPFRQYVSCGRLPLVMDPSMPPVDMSMTQIVYNDVACIPLSCDLSGGFNEQMLLQLVEFEGGEDCTTHIFKGPIDDVAPSKSGKASKGAKSKERKEKKKGRGDQRQ